MPPPVLTAKHAQFRLVGEHAVKLPHTAALHLVTSGTKAVDAKLVVKEEPPAVVRLLVKAAVDMAAVLVAAVLFE
jgi:hypothetical protein